MNIAPFLFVACVLGACRATELRAKETDAPLTYQYGGQTLSHEQIEVTLARSECYGKCPVYTVTVFGSGQVEFHGEKYTKVEGEAGWDIPVSTVQLLLTCIEGFPLSSYTDTRNDRVSDSPTITISLRLGSQSYFIENLWAVFPDEETRTIETMQHSQLDDLAYFIDVCAGTGPYVRTR